MGTHQRAERAWYGGCPVGTSTKVHLSTGLFIFHFPTGGVPICHIPVHTRACVQRHVYARRRDTTTPTTKAEKRDDVPPCERC